MTQSTHGGATYRAIEIGPRKDELATLFANGDIDAVQLATGTRAFTSGEDAISGKLAAVAAGMLAGGDVRRCGRV